MRALVFLALAGCSLKGSAAANGGPCAARPGLYVAGVGQPTSNCPWDVDAATQVITTAEAPLPALDDPDAGCTSTVTPSADNCTVSYDTVCPVRGYQYEQTGTLDWTQSGTMGGTLLFFRYTTLDGGQPVCNGTYDLLLMQQ